MRSVIYITIILASLTATSLSATAATVNNAAITKDVPDVLTLCDPFAITGEITGEADTDVYYGGKFQAKQYLLLLYLCSIFQTLFFVLFLHFHKIRSCV